MSSRRCAKCGQVAVNSDFYCAQCGAALPAEPVPPAAPAQWTDRFSGAQLISILGLVLGVAVALLVLAHLTDGPFGSRLGDPKENEAAIAKVDCLIEEIQNKQSDGYDDCADQVERRLHIGPYEPWYEQHPVLTALGAGAVTFFVIAGGGRLFLK